MKTNRSFTAPVAILLALAFPLGLTAQHTRYKLVDLGTFRGPQSYVNMPNNYAPVLNDRVRVAGWADTSTQDSYFPFCFNEDCFVSHAFESRNGAKIDLGVLPGGDSSASGWISANGLIAGISQNGQTDPLIPGPPFFPEFRAVLWKNGQITDLGTLPEGGYESLATAVNSHGVVVGFATNTNNGDPNSIFGFALQTRAFRWDEADGMQDLGTLGTGADATALLVNERGQIVGESYIDSQQSGYCANHLGFALTTGAFLWEHGEMKNLGSFGGTCTFATDLNNRGEVVGLSTLSGDKIQHAFLWKNGSLSNLPNTIGGKNAAAIALNNGDDVVGWASVPGDQDIEHEHIHASLWQGSTMTDLGTLDGDPCSLGFSVNARGQVVGVSVPACDFNKPTRAFLFEQGSIIDLNSLIPGDSPLYLTAPATINDRGEIAGVGLDSDSNQHALLLIPCGPDDTACQDAAPGPAFRPAPAITKPANNRSNLIRRMLRHQLAPLNNISDPSTSSAPSGSGAATTTLPTVETPWKLEDPVLPQMGVSTLSACAPKGALCNPVTLHCCSGYRCVVICGSTCQHFGRCE